MDDESIRGGCAGAAIASSMDLILIIATIFSEGPEELAVGAICILFFSAPLGFFAGLLGARSKSVVAAFTKGAQFALVLFVGCFLLGIELAAFGGVLGLHTFLVALAFAPLLISIGALISGMAAIVVRDYHDYRRWRLFPQFTLQELMIVVTLTAVILSAISSMFVSRYSLSAADTKPEGARLSTAEVIRIAKQVAELQGKNLRLYKEPEAHYESTNIDKSWFISFEGRGKSYPGNHFSVLVDDQTGEGEFFPGR